MTLTVCLDHRFRRTPEGAVWTQAAFAWSFWRNYLAVFGRVEVAARLLDVEAIPADWVRADGEAVKFIAIPHYLGPAQYLRRLREIRRVVHSLSDERAVIMRVPSFIATHVSRQLYRTGRPFGVEVVGDPYEAFAPGSMPHPLRPFLRWFMVRQLREQCRRASAVAYVTQQALQRRYPCGAYSVGVSDVQLPGEAIVIEGDVLATHFSSVELDLSACIPCRKRSRTGEPVHLVTVASLEQPYKGIQHLLSALAICVGSGIDLQLTVVGDGKFRKQFEAQAAELGLSHQVDFVGQIQAGAAVRGRLDAADLFVLASLTEGLPRAMIEAMARGLPCIGTSVGGIPELLGSPEMVPPADPRALAAKIVEVTGNEERMAVLSARNIAKARDFSEEALRERRLAYYNHLRQVTRHWMADRNRGSAGDWAEAPL